MEVEKITFKKQQIALENDIRASKLISNNGGIAFFDGKFKQNWAMPCRKHPQAYGLKVPP